MDETFELPVQYSGTELFFNTKLIQQGYIHRFVVEIDGVEVAFEPDEERNYRAIVDPRIIVSSKMITIPLLEAVANAIENVIK